MFVFFRSLLKSFFAQTLKNPKLYMEVLFFKDKKVVLELGEDSEGYRPYETKSDKKKKRVAWPEEEQDELKKLFEKFKRKFEPRENDDDAEEHEADEEEEEDQQKYQGNEDLIDLIMINLKEDGHSRRDICAQLVNIGCVKSIDEFKTGKYKNKNGKKLGRNKIWRENDVEDLRKSFEVNLHLNYLRFMVFLN